MSYLKNTAGQYLYLAMIAKADGSAITSGTVNGYRSIDGGAQAAVTGTISHKGNGQWQLALSQADTNGDDIGYLFTHTSGIPVSITIVTDTKKVGTLQDLSSAGAQAAAAAALTAYDPPTKAELDAGLAALNDLDATAVQAAAAAALTAYDPPTKAELDAGLAGLNDPDAAAIADAVWDEAISGHLTAGSTGEALDNAGAAGSPPTAAAIADAVWDEALAGHAAAGSTGEALAGAGSAGDPWATPLPGAYGAGTAGKILGDNLDAAVSSRSTFDPAADTVDVGKISGDAPAADNLESMLDGTGGGTLSLGALKVIGTDPNGVVYIEGSGTYAMQVKGTGLNSYGIGAIGAGVGAGVRMKGGLAGLYAEGNYGVIAAGALQDIQADIYGNLNGSVGSVASPGGIADAVWDEALAGHLTAGSTGEALDNAGAAGSPPTAGEVADAVWDEALAGHAGAGSTGEALAGAGAASDPYLGRIWLNPAIGTAGTTPGVNGTATNPATTLADAMTLADALGYSEIHGVINAYTPGAAQPAGTAVWTLRGQYLNVYAGAGDIDRLELVDCYIYGGPSASSPTHIGGGASYGLVIKRSKIQNVAAVFDAIDCAFYTGARPAAGARWINCRFSGVELNINGAASLYIYGGQGLISISNMTGGSITVFADDMTVNIMSTATAGQLVIQGRARIGTNNGGLTILRPSTEPIADAVWDEALAGHVAAGSAGAALSAAGSAGDPWDTAVPGAYAAGTAGYLLGTYLDAAISSRSDFDPGTDQVDVGSMATAVAQAIADEVLKRGVANVEDTANTASLAAIILATLESSISGSTWTIRKTAGGTFATKTVTTDAGAEPIVGVD